MILLFMGLIVGLKHDFTTGINLKKESFNDVNIVNTFLESGLYTTPLEPFDTIIKIVQVPSNT